VYPKTGTPQNPHRPPRGTIAAVVDRATFVDGSTAPALTR